MFVTQEGLIELVKILYKAEWQIISLDLSGCYGTLQVCHAPIYSDKADNLVDMSGVKPPDLKK